MDLVSLVERSFCSYCHGAIDKDGVCSNKCYALREYSTPLKNVDESKLAMIGTIAYLFDDEMFNVYLNGDDLVISKFNKHLNFSEDNYYNKNSFARVAQRFKRMGIKMSYDKDNISNIVLKEGMSVLFNISYVDYSNLNQLDNSSLYRL